MTLQQDKTNTNTDGGNNQPNILEGEQIKQLFNIWTEILKIPTVGPVYAYSKESSTYAHETINISGTLVSLHTNLYDYWSKVNRAFITAVQEILKSAPKKYTSKEDFENYRKIAIDAFEASFSNLFDSKEFATAYGRVFSNQLDLVKQVQNIAESNLKILNVPTRTEVNEMLKDIHDMKLTIRELKKKMEMTTQNETRNTSA